MLIATVAHFDNQCSIAPVCVCVCVTITPAGRSGWSCLMTYMDGEYHVIVSKTQAAL